jgi:DNA-binding GntR family transcriptional regulator
MNFSFSKLDVQPDERIADAVFARLRRGIVRHEIPPGFHLSVPALAKQFGASRSPVHEAVKRLVQEGLAKEEPRRGAFVTIYSSPALVPLYEVRYVLEGLAASLAAERASQGMIQEMSVILDNGAEAVARDDIELHIELDIQFHRMLLTAAANPALEEMLAKLYERIKTAMVARVVPTGPEQALADHREILNAIARRDSVAADRLARAHVMRVYTKLASQRAVDLHGHSGMPMMKSEQG